MATTSNTCPTSHALNQPPLKMVEFIRTKSGRDVKVGKSTAVHLWLPKRAPEMNHFNPHLKYKGIIEPTFELNSDKSQLTEPISSIVTFKQYGTSTRGVGQKTMPAELQPKANPLLNPLSLLPYIFNIK